MAIWVSSLALAPSMVDKHRPSRVLSLLSPYDDFPFFRGISDDRHLKIAVHDIQADSAGMRAPAMADAEAVVRFVEGWDRRDPMLIHCFAGISRSTASAFIAACVHNPETPELQIANAIRAASPTASPNPRLVAHADDILGRGGRMVDAVTAIGRGELIDWDRTLPFFIPSRFEVRG